jgi:hypothetical protein
MGLTACTAPPRAPAGLEIDDTLLICLPRPNVPPRPRSEAVLVEWVLALDEAGEDCRARLATIAGQKNEHDAEVSASGCCTR